MKASGSKWLIKNRKNKKKISKLSAKTNKSTFINLPVDEQTKIFKNLSAKEHG